MKNFLATTATALIISTAAYADGHTASFKELTFDHAANLNASEVIGMRVYATEASIEGLEVAAGGETEWDDIGEINEIVITRSGEVQSVIVGVGGFLGLGEKDVAIDMQQLQFVTDEGDSDDFFIVVKASSVGVKDAPEYHADNMASEKHMPLTAPMIERDGYNTVTIEDLNTEDLTGARVYGLNNEDVGEISELLITTDGNIDRAIIDVGGFIGIGEKPVAVTMNELQITRADDSDTLRVYIESSQEALEALPEYEG